MEFVEKRDLLRQLPDEARQLVQRVVCRCATWNGAPT
jgi:adenylate kinase